MSQPVSPPVPPNVGWETKALILAGGPAVGMALAGITSALPRIEAALAHTPEDKMLVKLLIGIVGAAAVIGPPLTGFLADRIGLKKVLVAIYALFTVAGAAGMFVNDLHVLAVLRFLCGLAGTSAVTATIIIINKRLSPAHRPTWFGIYIAVAAVAAIAMQPLAGMLADIHWSRVFAIYLFGLPFALIAALAFKESPGDALRPAADESGETRESLFSWFPFWFLPLALTMGCIVYLPMIYVPFLLRDMGVQSATQIGLALAADALACAVLATLYGPARRRLPEWAAYTFAFVATGIGGVTVAFANGYAMVIVGMAIAGLGVGWFMPTLMTGIGSRVKPHQQGRAAGLVKAANYLSTPMCVVAAEPVFRAFGAQGPILLSSVAAFSLLLLVWLLEARRRRAVGTDAVAGTVDAGS